MVSLSARRAGCRDLYVRGRDGGGGARIDMVVCAPGWPSPRTDMLFILGGERCGVDGGNSSAESD